MSNKYLEKLASKESNHLFHGATLFGGAGALTGGLLGATKQGGSLRSAAIGAGIGAVTGAGIGTYLAHKGNKQNVRTPEEMALRESNDETYQDMIPYVDKYHDNLNVSKTPYGQIHFAALDHKGKTIGVRMLDPKYNDEGNYIGNHRDTMVIHPKFRKEYGHLHLKDGKAIEKDPEFFTDWS